MPDLDWDQLTYITASAEAKGRLEQDKEKYRRDREHQCEQQRRQEEERQKAPVNLAGLEALKRGFGFRSRPGVTSRAVAASRAAVNVRMAADSVLAASLVEEEGDLQAVTEEIIARVRAQDMAEMDLLPQVEEVVEEQAAVPEEVNYAFHYGHSKGLAPGEMEIPSAYAPDFIPERRKRSVSRPRRPRSSSRGRGLVSLYVEEEEDEGPEVVPRRTKCPLGHPLERWTCRVEGAQCEVCGPFPLPRHSVLFGCRICSWHLCSLHGAEGDRREAAEASRPAKKASEEARKLEKEVRSEAEREENNVGVEPPRKEENVATPVEASRPSPAPESAPKRLSYKEKMKQRMEQAAKNREEGKEVRKYEWAGTGEAASAIAAERVLDKVRQEEEDERQALRPPSPRLDLPEGFCPLCHQIETGAKKPLTKGGHSLVPGYCRRAKAR